MSTKHAKIKVRNRTVELKWITQYCDHIMSNYINDYTQHDLTFQEISNMLRSAYIGHLRGAIWEAKGVAKGHKYLVILQLTPKFAIVKTCYRYGWTNK